MSLYRRGSVGPEVSRIQSRLQELDLYRGPVDGVFGGGTEAAIRNFQEAKRLGVDGKVGPETWTALFDGQPIPLPAILDKPLAYRCLALTGAFESDQPPPDCFCGLSGDFDGQGISFGVCQWNLGQGSLQPLLQEMDSVHADVFRRLFGPQYAELKQMLTASRADQLAWARSIQTPKHVLTEPWRGLFKALGRTEEFQEIEVKHARNLYTEALSLCSAYQVASARAAALMFDIKVQNGSISSAVRKQIEDDFKQLDQSLNATEIEVARLRIIANRRADAAKPKWREDVRARKLTIGNGEGVVHGKFYNLADNYGITIQAAAAAAT